MFPKSTLPAGHLLRDWSRIPGRTPSPVKSQRRSLADEKQNDIEEEIERELETINKQSEAFLRSFTWREDQTGSPDLFGDLSTSATSIVEEADPEENVMMLEERRIESTSVEKDPEEKGTKRKLQEYDTYCCEL